MAKAKQSKESADSKFTTDHEEIRGWVEERGGHPAKVKETNLLRIDYPGFSGEQRLEEIAGMSSSKSSIRTIWYFCIRTELRTVG